MSKRLFSNKHVWVLSDGERVTIGITEFAQEKLGSIMFLNLPDEGEIIEAGQRFGDIESIKNVSDLVSPVSGEVVKVNDELIEEPEAINEDPYESWFLEVKVADIPDDLMHEETYLQKKDEL